MVPGTRKWLPSSQPDSPEPQQIISECCATGYFCVELPPVLLRRVMKRNWWRSSGRTKLTSLMTLSIFIVLADPIAVLRLSLSFSYRHHQVVGEKVSSNGDVQEEGVQDVKWYWTKHNIHTGNVECSAQCNATRFGEKLGDRWQYLPKQSVLMSWRSKFAHSSIMRICFSVLGQLMEVTPWF